MRSIFLKAVEKIRKKEGGRSPSGTFRLPSSFFLLPSSLFLASFLLTSCLPLTRPTLQIGLVAPFEGRYRDAGYEVIYALRLAVREVNRAGGVAGRSVELVALDDSGDPAQAAEQARKLAADPQVLAVLGHWLDETTLAAAPLYAQAGVPLLATTSARLPPGAFRLWPTEAALRAALPAGQVQPCFYPCGDLEALDWLADAARDPSTRVVGPPRWGLPQFPALAPDCCYAQAVDFVAPAPLPADSADPYFAARYRAISNGVEARAYAVLAYDATRLLLDALARDAKANGQPARAGVEAALAQANFTGLSGQFSFDADRNWAEARGWVYRWRDGKVVKP
ncbi:MAG: ABC transporter substrate-binding protein [Chloroflexi bacterium]|nr:ABC transporter substrate-binding protein [Chloroflexota bacterium]